MKLRNALHEEGNQSFDVKITSQQMQPIKLAINSLERTISSVKRGLETNRTIDSSTIWLMKTAIDVLLKHVK